MPKIVVTENNIDDILKEIKTWKGKLTWSLLCEHIAPLLGLESVTKQTLASYKEIQEAYTEKKQHLRENAISNNNAPSPQNSNIEYLQSQIESLEAELEIANNTIEKYKQRFVLWQYNAYKHGIRIDSLDDAVDMLEKPLQDLKRKTGGA